MSASESFKKYLDEFEKAATTDVDRAPDASPWSLVHLSNMRHVLRAYNFVRESLISEKVSHLITSEMTIEEKHEIEGQVIESVEKMIDESL